MEIEHSQTIIGSDISVHAASGAGSVIGQSLLVAIDGSATGEVVGQRVSVSADRPRQSLIGQRISVGIGRPPPVENRAPQREEVNDTIGQLREAAKALKTSDAPRSWVTGLLTRVERWEVPALSGAISGVAGAMTQWAIGG